MEGMKKVEVLRAACCVAGIDGETSPEERRVLDMLAAQAGVGLASLTAMIERSESDQGFYKEQFRVLKAEPKETMKLLIGIALADNKLRTIERQVLERLGKRLGVDKETFDNWLSQAIEYVKSRETQ